MTTKQKQARKTRTMAAKSTSRRVKKVAPTKPSKTSKTHKVSGAKQALQGGFEQINRVLNRFEKEVETVVKKIVKQGEQSRKDLRKNFDQLAKKVRKGKFLQGANATREELEKEVRRVAEDVVATLKEIESLLNTKKVSAIFSEVKEGVNDLVHTLTRNGFVVQLKQAVEEARGEVLGLLSIPTQTEVEKLEKKIINLEKRLSNLSRKAA